MIERKAFTVLKYSLLPARVRLPGGGANRHFQLQKRSQLFIRTHNETLPVVAVRVRETLDGQKRQRSARIPGSCTGRRLRERRSFTKASRQLNSIQAFGPSLP
jgi:hypothetical protein